MFLTYDELSKDSFGEMYSLHTICKFGEDWGDYATNYNLSYPITSPIGLILLENCVLLDNNPIVTCLSVS